MIDIARKSGQKLNYHFTEIDETFSFFNLNIKIGMFNSYIIYYICSDFLLCLSCFPQDRLVSLGSAEGLWIFSL